ncbi:MAG: bifunctional enoyl-CoA hydratase/phosphate acetyltransferase [Lachnospiraceae bacterium]|nr:bifunctional enoyl-CoA hydratase/phosphate acetyltransferase [Lachnospiraceae bacterium]
MFQTLDEVLNAARQREACTMAVAAAQDADVLKAVCAARDAGLIRPLLLGEKSAIREAAGEAEVSVREEEILDIPDKTEACRRAALLARDGKADLIMKGGIDTASVMKAVLSREMNLRESSLISHVAVMEVPGYDRLFYLTDSSINIAPTLEQKAAILQNAVEVAHALGNEEPKAAVLCALETVNPKMKSTVDAYELKLMNQRGELTGCLVDGPLALDESISEEAARHKKIEGPVAGHAEILLVPDVECGNALNKAMVYFGHAQKAGIVMGARIPVVLTSRNASPRSKLNSIALAVLIADRQRRKSHA